MDIERQDWNGCYNGGWQAAPLVPEAYSHPAKVSFALAERIYRHMLTEGWLAPGDVVIDPFGGVGGLGFHAALYGMHWTGIELEQKFVDLGNQNLELWRDRYAPHFPNYGTARLVQGDSRRLVDVVTGAGGVVSSPPYADGAQHTGGETRMTSGAGGPIAFVDYGDSPGQLASMPTTFWEAAAQIVAQCYAILRPGGYAAFVTGDFVRNKRRVPFGEQWLALCVACGFEPVLWAVAHKAEHLGTQRGLFGGDVELTKTRVSFFRRLANQNNPDAAITNEDILFLRKPMELSR